VTATGQSQVAPAGSQTLHFSYSDIALRTTKASNGTPAFGQMLASIGDTAVIGVGAAPAGTGALISALLRDRLSTALQLLEPQLTSILASAGLRVGYVDVRATAVRCGLPALAM
jgi:uncharacterized membrane protein